MALSFRIETLDRSGRWYLTPGARSVYELRIRNDSKNGADCSLVVEDPASGVTVEPNAFSLDGHEVRTVTVTFAPDTTASRSQRVLLSLHSDNDGSLLATFEHPLVLTGGTDCSISMVWKDAIIEAGALCGFEMACSVRSQSETQSAFQVTLSPHASLSAKLPPEISLEPGQVGQVILPIRWDRSIKDSNGFNHPQILEVTVPVSNGRRTSRIRWEVIEAKLEPFMKQNGVASNGSAASTTSSTAPVAATVPPQRPQPAPIPDTTQKVLTLPERDSTPDTAAASIAENGQHSPIPLMINGHATQLMLAAPVEVQTNTVDNFVAAGPSTTSGEAASEKSQPAATSTHATREAIELPLFAQPVTPAAQPQSMPATPQQPELAAASASPATPAAAPALGDVSQTPPAAQDAPPAPASKYIPTSPATPTPAPKLTPYTKASWDPSDDFVIPTKTAVAEAEVVPVPDVVPSSPQTTRVRLAVANPKPRRSIPPGLLIGGLAAIALVVAGILFKPGAAPQAPSTSPVTVTTPVIAQQANTQPQGVSTVVYHKHVVVAQRAKPRVVVAGPTPRSAAPVATPRPATPAPKAASTEKPATPTPATPKPAARHIAARPLSQQHAFQHIKLYQPESGSVVALGTVEAYYGPRGRAVRVLWGAAEQASASVQLIDNQGKIVSATSVRGGRQSAVLYLPRGFRGALTVQVSSVGKLGERVANTTSLSPFGQ